MRSRRLWLAAIACAALQSTQLSAEQQWTEPGQQQIATFWQTVQPQQLKLQDGSLMPYVVIRPEAAEQPKATLVLVNGRTESYLKYQELAYQLSQQGYQLLMFDHRGQGLSARLTDNPYKGHIYQFQQYVDDMHQLISQVLPADKRQPWYLLGHSMGGAVSTLYLQQHPQVFQKAVLSAPMLGIQGKLVYDEQDGCRLANLVTAFSTEGYAGFADRPYVAVPFVQNELTGSKQRYQWIQDLYQQRPELQLGGATWGWLQQACAVLPHIRQQATQIRIPLLLLQAELDSIVSASAQQQFCDLLSSNPDSGCVGGVQLIKGAKHELLFEQEEIRQQVLAKILAFFAAD
jgi:lysophospholipase